MKVHGFRFHVRGDNRAPIAGSVVENPLFPLFDRGPLAPLRSDSLPVAVARKHKQPAAKFQVRLPVEGGWRTNMARSRRVLRAKSAGDSSFVCHFRNEARIGPSPVFRNPSGPPCCGHQAFNFLRRIACLLTAPPFFPDPAAPGLDGSADLDCRR